MQPTPPFPLPPSLPPSSPSLLPFSFSISLFKNKLLSRFRSWSHLLQLEHELLLALSWCPFFFPSPSTLQEIKQIKKKTAFVAKTDLHEGRMGVCEVESVCSVIVCQVPHFLKQ